MRVSILAIGRLKHQAESEIISRYQKRFSTLGRRCGLGPLEIVEFPESQAPNLKERLTNEAERLIKASNPFEYKFLLDMRGDIVTSRVFAQRLQNLTDKGIKSCVFLIGGPDGCGEDILKRATSILSLSSLTLTHALARMLLAEQLYRTVTILTGHPYHR